MHRKIIANTLSSLDKERLAYFEPIANRLEQDPRCQDQGNIIFTVLKDVLPDTPIYLEPAHFIDLLFEFVSNNGSRIRGIIYDPRFIHNPQILRTVTGSFILLVVNQSLAKQELGEIDEGELSVHKLTWPYRDTDVYDPDDDPDEWVAAIERSEKWRLEKKTDRRKGGLSRIDDKAMALFREKLERESGDG